MPLDPSQPVLYIVGDVHLTGEQGPFLPWLDRLAARPPARLVILGDLFEYWIDTSATVLRFTGVFERLRTLHRLGWRIDLIRGNREMVAGRRLAMAAGTPLRWPSLDLTLGSRRVRVVHGDRLCGQVGQRLFIAWLSSFWFRTLQAAHPAWAQNLVALGIRRLSRGAQDRRYRAGRHPRFDPRWVRGAAQGVDTLVAGHIHQQQRLNVAGVDLLIVGDWPPEGGQWIEGFSDGHLRQVKERLT